MYGPLILFSLDIPGLPYMSPFCWSSLLDSDHRLDTGAAHRDEAGLQAVVVVCRPFWPDAPQQQHLVHDGSGLQVPVFLAL